MIHAIYQLNSYSILKNDLLAQLINAMKIDVNGVYMSYNEYSFDSMKRLFEEYDPIESMNVYITAAYMLAGKAEQNIPEISISGSGYSGHFYHASFNYTNYGLVEYMNLLSHAKFMSKIYPDWYREVVYRHFFYIQKRGIFRPFESESEFFNYITRDRAMNMAITSVKGDIIYVKNVTPVYLDIKIKLIDKLREEAKTGELLMVENKNSSDKNVKEYKARYSKSHIKSTPYEYSLSGVNTTKGYIDNYFIGWMLTDKSLIEKLPMEDSDSIFESNPFLSLVSEKAYRAKKAELHLSA